MVEFKAVPRTCSWTMEKHMQSEAKGGQARRKDQAKTHTRGWGRAERAELSGKL